MNNQLDELRKWSEEFTRSAWEGFSQMLKGFQADTSSRTDSAGELLERLVQLNQLTLSTMEQYRYWEKLNESMKQISNSLLGGFGRQTDSRTRELESQIDVLKTRLNAQEKLLQELQSRLKSEEEHPADEDRTTDILSKFFSEQTRQFQKLVKPED